MAENDVEEIKEEFTEAEIKQIEANILEQKTTEPEEVTGLSFDLTDDELASVVSFLMEMNEKWIDVEYDMSKSAWFRDEVTTGMAQLGFVVSVGWIPAQYVNPRNEFDTLRVFVPDIALTPRPLLFFYKKFSILSIVACRFIGDQE